MNLSIRHWLAEKKQQSYDKQAFCSDITARLSFSIITDLEVKSLTPLDISPLAEILELPLSVVWQEVEFVATMTENLLNNLSQKKPLKRNEGVWLTFQIAYLRGLRQVIEQEINLCQPWVARSSQKSVRLADNILEQNDLFCEYFLPDIQLQGLLKTIRPGKLNDNQAEQALSFLDESLLVQQFNQVTVAWLMANGAEENVAKLIIQRLGYGFAGHLLAVVAENAAPLAQLQKFVRLGNPLPGNLPYQSTQAADTIDLIREQYRAHLLQQASKPLFLEVFALKDIYIPPKGLPIGENIFESVDLSMWVEQHLNDTQNIMVIEGVAGIGKSSFCQVLANHVATNLYPTWMPILIRLRDIIYSEDLAESLNRAFFANSQVHLAEWLENPNLRCLLILDGWDELPPSEKIHKVKFLQQLLDLQLQSPHHVVVTSQPGKLVEIFGELSPQFQRICIQPWEPHQLRQWFQVWGKVLSMSLSQNLFTFCKQAGVFKANSPLPELSVMVRQPLMLYLLGVLYRDGLLDEEILKLAFSSKQKGNATLMWEIYQRLSFWLLGYPHIGGVKPILVRETETHVHRTQNAIAFQLKGLQPQDLIQKIKAVSLQILQSQQGSIGVDVETSRLLPSFYFKSLVEQSQKLPHQLNTINKHQFNSVSIPKKAYNPEWIGNRQETTHDFEVTYQPQKFLKTEFSHALLGEFLCAQAIIQQIKLIIRSQPDNYGGSTLVMSSPQQLAQHIYSLLGYGIVNTQIRELVIAGLRKEPQREFSFVALCDRLGEFWYAYCRGRWFDEGFAHEAWKYFRSLNNPINVEQVNTSVGINLFFLLCASHREANLQFSPCHHPQTRELLNPEALLLLINKSIIFSNYTFANSIAASELINLNLTGAELSGVMLVAANLVGVNLVDSKLVAANLTQAQLQNTNLAGANLTGANLTGANLTGANLTGANLAGANLTGANIHNAIFINACLHHAILAECDRQTLKLNGAMFSLEEYKLLKNLLLQHSRQQITNSNTSTNIWLDKMTDMGIIESAEGEMTSEDFDYEAEDDTMLGV
jgi:uncharacterized protein YjbI with pentapeptide repeats